MELKPKNNIRSAIGPVPEKDETLAACDLLGELTPADLAICVSFLQQCVGDAGPNYTSLESFRARDKSIRLTGTAKDRFKKILTRLVKGQEGLSRLEISYIRHIWHEFRGDWDQAIGAPGLNAAGR
jgi:hypothetical protein